MDKDTPRGCSPFYVEDGMKLADFRAMLPSVFRTGGERFAFPPIRHTAAGQNLWSVLDRPSWEHIRKSAYTTTGQRCGVCGERGGYVARTLFPDGSRDGVECHEVWEWQMAEDEKVGVQKLARVLVLCVSCHSAFHESYFVRIGESIGQADAIRSFIERRRMVMNNVDQNALLRQLSVEHADLQRASGVREWVIDLSHLASQQFMTGRIPVFRESNTARMDPGRIAGMSFETDGGVAFPSTPVDILVSTVVSNLPARSNLMLPEARASGTRP